MFIQHQSFGATVEEALANAQASAEKWGYIGITLNGNPITCRNGRILIYWSGVTSAE